MLVIVPVHNEALSLGAVLSELRAHAPDCDVVVVNDGSTDATADVARAARRAGASICASTSGSAARCRRASSTRWSATTSIAVQLDGDGQHLAEEIAPLIEPVRAGRVRDGDRLALRRTAAATTTAAPRGGWRRTLLSRICGALTGQRITDATSGFRAYGPRALRYLASYYPADYPEPEAIVLLSRRGLPICEVPVRMRPRQGGRSSISGTRTVYYMAKVTLSLLLAAFKEGPARQTT